MYDLFHRIFIRTMGYRIVVFSMLLMLLSPLAIADEMGADDQVIALILDRSGINQHFLQLPKILRMQLAQQPPPIAFSDAREFTEIVVSAVDPDKMQGDMTRYLRAHYEDSRYRKFLSLLEEPLTWTPPVCQVNFEKKNRLQSYIRPVDGVCSPGLYGIRRRGPI